MGSIVRCEGNYSHLALIRDTLEAAEAKHSTLTERLRETVDPFLRKFPDV